MDDELDDVDSVDETVPLLLLEVVDPRLEDDEGGGMVVDPVDPFEVEVPGVKVCKN